MSNRSPLNQNNDVNMQQLNIIFIYYYNKYKYSEVGHNYI